MFRWMSDHGPLYPLAASFAAAGLCRLPAQSRIPAGVRQPVKEATPFQQEGDGPRQGAGRYRGSAVDRRDLSGIDSGELRLPLGRSGFVKGSGVPLDS